MQIAEELGSTLATMGTVISIKKKDKIASLNTTTVGQVWLCTDRIGYVSQEVQWEVPQLWQVETQGCRVLEWL